MRKSRHGQEGFTGFGIAIHVPLRRPGKAPARRSRRTAGPLRFASVLRHILKGAQGRRCPGAMRRQASPCTGIGVTDRPRHTSKHPAPAGDKDTGSGAARSAKPAHGDQDRGARLAAALRANLRRRKAAAQRDPALSEDHDAGDPAGEPAQTPDTD